MMLFAGGYLRSYSTQCAFCWMGFRGHAPNIGWGMAEKAVSDVFFKVSHAV
jgi:hypothetical protein